MLLKINENVIINIDKIIAIEKTSLWVIEKDIPENKSKILYDKYPYIVIMPNGKEYLITQEIFDYLQDFINEPKF